MKKPIRIGIVGAPSSGKTTLIDYIENNLNILFDNLKNVKEILVYREIARKIIEEKVRSGLTLKEIHMNSKILQKDILEENVRLFKESDKINGIVFFDTTIVCGGVYQDIYSNGIFPETFEYIEKYRYDYIFLTEHTGFIEPDGIRINDVEDNLKITQLIEAIYKKNNYTINYLPTFLPKGIDPKKIDRNQMDIATIKRFQNIINFLIKNI